MSTKAQRTSGGVDIIKNKQNISRTPRGRLSVRPGVKNEIVEERRRSGRGRKDTAQDPGGKMSLPGAQKMLEDPHRILKDARMKEETKEEENELDFAAIEKKIFEGQEKMLNLGKQTKNKQNNAERRSRTAIVKQERGRSKNEEEEEEEEEELDFAAIEKKIFEGQETMLTPGKQRNQRNDSILGERRRRVTILKDKKKEEELGRRGIKEDVINKGKEEQNTKTAPGNLVKRIKKEEEEKEERRVIKKEGNKEKTDKGNIKRNVKKEEKEEKLSKMPLKIEKEGMKVEKEEGKIKEVMNNVKRENKTVGRKRVIKQEEEGEEEGRERKRIRTETPERRKTDLQKDQKRRGEEEEGNKRRRGGSKEQKNQHTTTTTTNRQAERNRSDTRHKKTEKTGETLNKQKKNRDRGKNREEKEMEEDRKRTGGKRRGGGRGEEEKGKGKRIGEKEGRKLTAQASDSEMSDWEEVGEMEGVDEVKELLSQPTSSSPQGEGGGEGVRIELDAPETLWGMKKRKKRRTEEELIEEYLRRKVNDTIRQVTQNAHKVHLLCLLAHGRHLNTTLGCGTLLAAALSTTPGRDAHPPGRLDLKHLQRLVTWFGKKFPISKHDLEKNYWDSAVDEVLIRRFGSGEVRSVREAVLCFVVLCRALGISARLVMALQPLSWKPAPGTLIKPSKVDDESDKNVNLKSSSSSPSLQPSSSTSTTSTSSSSQPTSKKPNAKKPNRKMVSSDSETSPPNPTSGRGRGRAGGVKRRKTIEEEEEEEEEEDSDFEPRNTKFRKPCKFQKKRRKSQEEEDKDEKKRRKSKDGEGEERKKKKKADSTVEWVEVFVEEEEKWVCVDVVKGKIHCVSEIEARMPPGSAYITAFNPDLTVKDVTQRYVSRWLSSAKKLRCCSEWWGEALRPFKGFRTQREKDEDEELEKALLLQPLPKTVAEYKNHPLYALQRHLLKFEAIYPPDVSPAGFFKGEPVYPRSSVHNLHSRDTWMKEAKSVRVDEEPYKTVKARPKWDRVTCQVIKDRPLELFGEWQVEDYEPPVASGGKVPRNEYGNVELFKPSMLPRGCVHLPVSGLNRLARKLNIDCAPAMVGFDFHSGWTHPVYEGYVVCEEFKDTLMDAWNQEQAEQARRAEEKRQKRIWDNWRKLIKGVLVRERVRQEYKVSSEEEEEEDEDDDGEGKKNKKKNKKTKKEEDDYEGNVDVAGNRKKVKQADIDALEREKERKEKDDNKEEENDPSTSSPDHHPRPPLITHQVKNLSIDLTSNVVEMAEKSRQRTMKTKNSVKRPAGKGRKQVNRGQEKVTKVRKGQAESAKVKEGQSGMAGLSEESEESDEEAKKEKIRAILSWGHAGQAADPDLSDDSDAEDGAEKGQPDSPFLGFSDLVGTKKSAQKSGKRKPKCHNIVSGEESGTDHSSSSSRSTTPEPDVTVPSGPRRLSSRSAKRRIQTYKEEEERESDADISLDESDFEDKPYKPVKD